MRYIKLRRKVKFRVKKILYLAGILNMIFFIVILNVILSFIKTILVHHHQKKRFLKHKRYIYRCLIIAIIIVIIIICLLRIFWFLKKFSNLFVFGASFIYSWFSLTPNRHITPLKNRDVENSTFRDFFSSIRVNCWLCGKSSSYRIFLECLE